MDLKKMLYGPQFSRFVWRIGYIFRALKNVNSNVRITDVQNFLESYDPYPLHKQVKKPRIYRRVYTKGIGYLYELGLVDLSKYKRENKGMTFIITMIDTFSKYGWVIPIRSKHGARTTKVLKY